MLVESVTDAASFFTVVRLADIAVFILQVIRFIKRNITKVQDNFTLRFFYCSK